MSKSTAQNEYDDNADDYRESKQLCFRMPIERYTLVKLLMHDLQSDQVGSLKVADLACGEGIYSRFMKDLGVHTTFGVDISPEMIKLAESTEASDPKGCKYFVGDAGNFDFGEDNYGTFDVVVSMYLLNYASTEEELRGFVRQAFKLLKPGGRFIGFNNFPEEDPQTYELYKKYGIYKGIENDTLEVGAPIKIYFINKDGSEFSVTNYYLPTDMHVRVFTDEGFDSFEWHGPFLDPVALDSFEPGFWDDFMQNQPMKGFMSRKPSA